MFGKAALSYREVVNRKLNVPALFWTQLLRVRPFTKTLADIAQKFRLDSRQHKIDVLFTGPSPLRVRGITSIEMTLRGNR